MKIIKTVLIFFFCSGLISAESQQKQLWTIEQCIDYAYRNSPTLALAGLNVEGQDSTLLNLRSKFDPKLTHSQTYRVEDKQHISNTSLNTKVYGGFDIGSSFGSRTTQDTGTKSSSFSLSLSKTILGGASFTAEEIALISGEIEHLKVMNNFNDTKRRLRYQIAQAFYTVIRNKNTLSIQKLRLKQAEKNLEHALLREEPLDIASAKVQLPARKISVESTEKSLQLSIDSLKLLIGKEIHEKLNLDTSFEYQPINSSLDNSIKNGLEHDVNLMNLKLTLKLQKDQISNAKEGIWPKIKLNATMSDSKSGDSDFWELKKTYSQSIGVSINYSLFQKSRKSALKTARINSDKTKINIFQRQQERTKTIKELWLQMQEEKKNIALQEQVIKVSEMRLNLFKDRWENGEIDILEVIRSENEFQNFKVELIKLKTFYMSNLAKYNYYLGN